jgi:hypothetical protein
MDALAWTGAIGSGVAAVGAVIAAIGAWRTEVTVRWQARAERLRTDHARIENDLHRARFTEIWEWAQAEPEGEKQIDAARWLGQHTGLSYPQQIAPGRPPSIPELRMNADEAYRQYMTALAGRQGRLGMSYPPYLHPAPPTQQKQP